MKTGADTPLDIDRVLEYREKYNRQFLHWMFKDNPKLEQDIAEYAALHHLDHTTNKSQLLYHLVTNTKTKYPTCKGCGKEVKVFGANNNWGYNNYCSRACTSLDGEAVKKRSDTRRSRGRSVGDKLRSLEELAMRSDHTNVNPNDIANFVKSRRPEIQTSGLKVLFLHRHPSWYKYVFTNFSDSNTLEEGLYMLINGATKPVCSTCHKSLQFKSFRSGYETCKNNNCIQVIKRQNRKIAESQEGFVPLDKGQVCARLARWLPTAPANSLKHTLRKADRELFKSVVFYHNMSGKEVKKFTETVYRLSTSTEKPPLCKHCKENPTKFRTILTGYQDHCCASCAAKSSSASKLETTLRSLRTKNFLLWTERFTDRTEKIITTQEEFIKTGKLTMECGHCGHVYDRNKAFDIRCPVCRKVSISAPELELGRFIEESCKLEVIRNSKKIIPPLEIDLFVPEKMIAIEFDGLYWHSNERVDRNYHLDKTEKCAQQGIHLIHVFENEWNSNKELVKSMISNRLGATENVVYARSCDIREVSNDERDAFLLRNHIQGTDNSKHKIGLFYRHELMSVMTFGKRKITGAAPSMELMRFCSERNTRVVGGASRLFSYFVKTYNPDEVTSYANRRYSNGSLYKSLGFELSHISPPNYWYFDSDDCRLGRLHHRSKFQKHKLPTLLKEKFNPNKTEYQNMKDAGFSRIWDCGNYVYKWQPTIKPQPCV